MTDTDNTAQRLADFIRAEGDKIVMDAPRQGQYREAETELHRLARVEAQLAAAREQEKRNTAAADAIANEAIASRRFAESELTEARERIAELEKRIERHQIHMAAGPLNTSRMVAEAETRANRLRAALKKYGDHTRDCSPDFPCLCGYADALKEDNR